MSTGSAYDPYWSVMPLVMALFLCTQHHFGADLPFRFYACLFLLAMWSLRLTWNWWRRLGHLWLSDGFVAEDWRYLDFKARTSSKVVYWVIFSFGGFHLFPTLLTFVGCMPLWYVLGGGAASSAALSMWDLAGAALMASCIALETLADWQMDRFLEGKSPKKVCRDGLWGISRHPK